MRMKKRESVLNPDCLVTPEMDEEFRQATQDREERAIAAFEAAIRVYWGPDFKGQADDNDMLLLANLVLQEISTEWGKYGIRKIKDTLLNLTVEELSK